MVIYLRNQSFIYLFGNENQFSRLFCMGVKCGLLLYERTLCNNCFKNKVLRKYLDIISRQKKGKGTRYAPCRHLGGEEV
jgi:hypothetical protein